MAKFRKIAGYMIMFAGFQIAVIKGVVGQSLIIMLGGVILLMIGQFIAMYDELGGDSDGKGY